MMSIDEIELMPAGSLGESVVTVPLEMDSLSLVRHKAV